MGYAFDIGLDLFPLLAATLACLACGLLGNFLVLRRLSLMGDAISHSVLPGIVVAFLIASSRSAPAMFLGAAVAGVATVVLVELIKKLGRVEPGAAMGVVFSILFATGVLLIETAAARQVDLDADCVLHGQLETLVWYEAPQTLGELLAWSTLTSMPPQVVTLAATLAATLGLIVLLFKELRLAAFDPAVATALGFNASLLHYLLIIFVAAATVASFEAVGSVLVIAMLICPAATSRLLTDRLAAQIACSAVVAVASAVGGYFAASIIPARFGLSSVNAAGAITTVAGGLFAATCLLAPRHGVLVRSLRRRMLAKRIAIDDLTAALFRASEQDRTGLQFEALGRLLGVGRARRAIAQARRQGLVRIEDGQLRLTDSGRRNGIEVVRRHRLWESFLVTKAGIAADHVHEPAEQFEHLGVEPPAESQTDPHGRVIPDTPGPKQSVP